MGRGASKASGSSKGGALGSAAKYFDKEKLGTNNARITKILNSDSAKNNPDFRLANEARAANLGNKYGTYETLVNNRDGLGDHRERQKGIIYEQGKRTYGISGGFADEEFDESWTVTDLKTGMIIGHGDNLYQAKDAILLFNDRTAHESSKIALQSAEKRFNDAKKKNRR